MASDADAEAEAAAPSAFEVWNDYDPSMRFITAYPMSAAQGTESSTIAYFACEPGQHSGLHADDAEELIYVADGEGEVFVSGVQKQLEAGGFLFVPKGVQHDIYAYGDVTLRLLSFFPSARVESTYTEMPAAVRRPHARLGHAAAERDAAARGDRRSTTCRRGSPRTWPSEWSADAAEVARGHGRRARGRRRATKTGPRLAPLRRIERRRSGGRSSR